jgi:hypothetical protein
MKNIISASRRKSDIQLVITAALRKELPVNWLNAHNIPVHTLVALKSGAINKHHENQPGILVVITGFGLKAGLIVLIVIETSSNGAAKIAASPRVWIMTGTVTPH